MGTANGSVLVIDDEEVMREVLETLLSRDGYDVHVAPDGFAGLELARSRTFDAAVVDVMMPGMDGMAVLGELKAIDEDLPVVMVTAFASVETALTAMKKGAFDYITKPFKNDEVAAVIRNAVERTRLKRENRILKQNLQSHGQRFANIIGRSAKIRQVFDLIMQAAPSRSTVLINGESGTGKELVARALHNNSTRAERAFVTVNSGNLPPDLLESNLFGHVKGAFTGAVAPKKGLFEVADKGTIFFDEIGNIPMETQAKLLRVIQEREFMRLGGVDNIKVDVRIIAATNVNLRTMMEENKFREDLYYRLHVIAVNLPALRERKEDIPLLVQHFLDKYGEENNRLGLELSAEALDLLIDYDWPGNVRELENLVERVSVCCDGDVIDIDDLPERYREPQRAPLAEVRDVASAKKTDLVEGAASEVVHRVQPHLAALQAGQPIDLPRLLSDIEDLLISKALELTGGKRQSAADHLGLRRTTLVEKLRRRAALEKAAEGATVGPAQGDVGLKAVSGAA